MVVGAGAAGLAAAVEAARWHPGRVVVLDQAPVVSVGTCGLAYLVGGQIADPEKLVLNTPQQLLERGLDVRRRCRVEEIDLANSRVHYRDLERGQTHSLPYEQLMLALGGQAACSHYANVLAPRDLESCLKARAYLQQDSCRRVLVVGAGYLGLELAETVRFAGRCVTLVDPAERLLGLVQHDLLVQELEKHRVDYRRARVVAWEGSRLARQAQLEDGSRVEFDLALLATGVTPSLPVLSSLKLERGPRGGVRVDSQGRTSRQRVFAAGDACEIPRREGPGHTYQPLARPAALLGQAAGATAAGHPRRFNGCLPCVAVKVFGLEAGWVGTSNGQTWLRRRCPTRAGYWLEEGWLDLALAFDGPNGALRAAQAVGSEGVAERLATLGLAIEQGLNAEQLSRIDTAYTPPLSPLWDPIARTVRAAKRWA